MPVADPHAPRRLTGLARRRAEARPLERGGSGINGIVVGALWIAAWLVLAVALVIPRSGFTTNVAPWLAPLLVGAAMALMESRTATGRLVHGPARAAVGPLAVFTVLAVATAMSYGAPGRAVAWIAASSLALAISLYAALPSIVRSKREHGLFLTLVIVFQVVILAFRVAAMLLL